MALLYVNGKKKYLKNRHPFSIRLPADPVLPEIFLSGFLSGSDSCTDDFLNYSL